MVVIACHQLLEDQYQLDRLKFVIDGSQTTAEEQDNQATGMLSKSLLSQPINHRHYVYVRSHTISAYETNHGAHKLNYNKVLL